MANKWNRRFSSSSYLMIVAICLCFIDFSFEDYNEQRLHEFLFHGGQNKTTQYNPLIRPVEDSSEPIRIQIDFGIKRLFEVDEANSKITLFAVSLKKWDDYFLKWSPKDFGGIEYTYLSKSDIWVPQLQLVSRYLDDMASNDVIEEMSNSNYPIKLFYNGTVEFNSIVHLTSTCLFENMKFPIGTQKCDLLFQLPYKKDKAIFTMSDYYTKEYEDYSALWTIDKTTNIQSKDINNNPIHVLQLQLRRQMRYYIYTLPSYIVYTLTLLMFMLPPDSSQRTMIGSCSIVITVVLTYMLSSALPHNEISAWPLLGKLYLFNMVLLTFSMLFSMFITKLACADHVRGVPDWLKKLTVNFLSKIFCIQAITLSVFNSYYFKAHDEESMERNQQINSELLMSDMSDVTIRGASVPFKTSHIKMSEQIDDQNDQNDDNDDDDDGNEHHDNGVKRKTKQTSEQDENSDRGATNEIEESMTRLLKKIYRHTDQLRYLIQQNSYRESARNEWFLVASLIDKILFFIYCFIIIFTTISIFKPN